MNKTIKDQLSKVKSAEINFKEDDTLIFIPKTTTIRNESLDIGNVYIIELTNVITNPDSASLLASNWNGGRIPQNKLYKAELVDKMSNMFRFRGVPIINGIDTPTENFYYWIPKAGFSVKESIK